MSREDSIKLVGYWNGSIDSPDIVFSNNPPENYKLVVMELQIPEENSSDTSLNKTSKKFLSSALKSEKSLKEISRKINTVNQIMRRKLK